MRYRRIDSERSPRRDREGQGQAAGRVHAISASCSRTSRSTRSRSPLPITITRCRPSGHARRARTSTSRSPARTICSRRGRSWPPRRSTTAWCSTGRSSGRRWAARRCSKMREGLIGDVYLARGLCFKRRDTIGRKPVSPVPPGVHYDLWLGPAPQHEFTANRFHYNWHWFWDYGNGDIGNQGVHQMDMARWGLGVKYPTKVSAMGGHFMFDDDQETPNTLTAQLRVRCRRQEEDDRIRGAALDHESRGGHRRSRSRGTRSARCSMGRRDICRSGTRTTASTRASSGANRSRDRRAMRRVITGRTSSTRCAAGSSRT